MTEYEDDSNWWNKLSEEERQEYLKGIDSSAD